MGDERKSMWCPLMREMCTDGWTPSMGKGKKKELPPKCRFWIKLMGKHPQKDEMIDEHDCSIAWLPTLMVEQCRIENSTGAAVESLRNRAADMSQSMQLLAQEIQNKPVIMLTQPETPSGALPAPLEVEKEKDKGDNT